MRIALLLPLLVPLATAGCFNVEEPICVYACGTGGVCPDDYECREDNYCHKKGTTGGCGFSDAAVAPDLEVDLGVPDLTPNMDLPPNLDLAPDLAPVQDMTMPPDLVPAIDLTVLPDLTPPPPDMTFVPDMAGFTALQPCPNFADYMFSATMTPTIQFGTVATSVNVYAPKCLAVPSGSMVTFQGATVADNFILHPLVASTRGSSGNPIASPADTTQTTTTITFTTSGFYPYYCSNHGANDGTGMAGVVWVLP